MGRMTRKMMGTEISMTNVIDQSKYKRMAREPNNETIPVKIETNCWLIKSFNRSLRVRTARVTRSILNDRISA